MKKNIFRQTWAAIAAVPAIVIGGLIVNSFTHWWGALAHATNVVWDAVSQLALNVVTFRIPIWAIVAVVVLIALTWYAVRKISSEPRVSAPNYLAYRQDSFDGVLCRWNYHPTFDKPGYKHQIADIECFCQYCDFMIGTPNEHTPNCPSCSRRAVKSNDGPFFTSPYNGFPITGYRRRESPMSFEDFIRREIIRRVRTGEWQATRKT